MAEDMADNRQSAVYSSEAIKYIQLHTKVQQIRIVGSVSNDIRIFWSDTVLRKLKILQNDCTLTICDEALPALYGVLGLLELTRENELLLQIPMHYKGSLCIQTTSNKVYLTDCALIGT